MCNNHQCFRILVYDKFKTCLAKASSNFGTLESSQYNLELLSNIASEQMLPNHVGVGQVLEAFAYVNLVDYIGTD